MALSHDRPRSRPLGMISYYIEQLLRYDFARFCVVGASGFVVNWSLLRLFDHQLGLPIVTAQLLGGELAYLSNFAFHQAWTYRKRTDKSVWRLLLEYHASSWMGLLLSVVLVATFTKVFRLDDTLSLVITSSIVLFWNFFWTKYYVWRTQERSAVVAAPVASKLGR